MSEKTIGQIIDDGGPAFPQSYVPAPDGGFHAAWGHREPNGDCMGGMSLRDFFAAHAMSAMVAGDGARMVAARDERYDELGRDRRDECVRLRRCHDRASQDGRCILKPRSQYRWRYKPRFEILGFWSGPQSPAGGFTPFQYRYTTRSRKLVDAVESMGAIGFTDGTHLRFETRELPKGEKAKKNMPYYHPLVLECWHYGVSSVDALQKAKKAAGVES